MTFRLAGSLPQARIEAWARCQMQCCSWTESSMSAWVNAGYAMPTFSAIVKSWKSFTSRQANARLGRTGPFWEADYFDRYMGNEDHLVRTIEYVENNPVKAGLVKEAANWPWSSASR